MLEINPYSIIRLQQHLHVHIKTEHFLLQLNHICTAMVLKVKSTNTEFSSTLYGLTPTDAHTHTKE